MIVYITSKSNSDDSLLNCRIDGLNNNKPDLFIIDLIKIEKIIFKYSFKKKKFSNT